MVGGLKEPEFSACALPKQAVCSASGISPSSLSVDVCLLLQAFFPDSWLLAWLNFKPPYVVST